MATKVSPTIMPIVSKAYCASSEVVLVVRRRPNVINGGGFVVVDCSQRIIFQVDGCGILGKKEELILKDGDGNSLLFIRRKGGIVEALSITRHWRGFINDFLGAQKLVFTLKDPSSSCLLKNSPIRIAVDAKDFSSYGNFQVKGDFPGRACSIVNSKGDVIAQIGGNKDLLQVVASRDVYDVKIKAGIDQAFVFGVIAVLDYIYDGSTRCSTK